jgi:hypothetical protein
VNGALVVHDDFAMDADRPTGQSLAFDRWVCISWEVDVAVRGVVRFGYDEGGGEKPISDGPFAESALSAALPERLIVGMRATRERTWAMAGCYTRKTGSGSIDGSRAPA